MKKDRNYTASYYETFQEVHAPEALAGKVMNMTNQNKNNKSFIKKFAVTAACLATLFVGSNAIAYAATGATWISGFFKDTTRWDGAVVGTEYVTVPGEMEITVSTPITEDGTTFIPVTIRLTDTSKAPFGFIEALSPGEVTLTDSTGAALPLDTDSTQISAAIIDGTAVLNLPLEAGTALTDTQSTLHIKSLYGSSKADAPLLIHGDWICPLP